MSTHPAFEAIAQGVQHAGMTFDVRCFVVMHESGIVLIDTGMPGNVEAIATALNGAGVQWADLTDIVLTHKHPDHVANVADVAARAGSVEVWAGAADVSEIPFAGPISPLADGDQVRGLRVIAAPGHTPGHICLMHDNAGLLFGGDAAGTVGGVLARGPAQFTEDAAEADRTLHKLATLDVERMVFSHGPEFTNPAAALRKLVAASE